jgi:phosphoribosyl 1,2-cyclic phosphodiesterase
MGRLRFSVLASGSGGNACYVETGHARILIDAGIPCRDLIQRLKKIGADPERLDALIITHEHSDHVRGAGAVARRFDLPVYLNRRTYERGRQTLGNLPKPIIFHTGQTLTIRDLNVETFTKCHDAADPVGVVLGCDGCRVGLATDLGRSTRLVEEQLKGCRAVILEFNHDVCMLEQGPYPLFLKRRIKGPDGHLSNAQAGEILGGLCHRGMEMVVLAHLSEINNTVEKALHHAHEALEQSGPWAGKVMVSSQKEPLPLLAP